ncbi:hypothetical protein [Novosphingobium malaysiense]|uniref:hypothetical protein n=1 Tax=Novosphingobium malaysiense TaxID=1348853 RepID=UPI0012DFFA77|nr:hypothetical protein [Novosphingobium malaysiense]
MGKPDFSDEFKRDAVAQITERGYAIVPRDPTAQAARDQHKLVDEKMLGAVPRNEEP